MRLFMLRWLHVPGYELKERGVKDDASLVGGVT